MSNASIVKRDNLTGIPTLKKLPPLELIPSKPIRDAIQAHADAQTRLAQKRRAYEELRQTGRAKAESADARALADATRAGKRDPGAKAVNAYEAELANAKRQYEAAVLIERDAFDDLQAVSDKHADACLAAVEKAESEAIDQYDQALERARETARTLSDHQAVAAFLRGNRRFTRPEPAIYRPDAESVLVADLLDTLSELGSTPERPRSPMALSGPAAGSIETQAEAAQANRQRHAATVTSDGALVLR